MFSFDYLLAVALLSAPPDVPVPELSPTAYARLQPTLEKLALRWEVMDSREVGFLLTRPEALTADLRFLRGRYHDLADAPSLSDGVRFPERELIGELLTFNRAYHQHLERRLSVDTVYWFELREAQQETDRLYHIYDTIRDARCDHYYVTARRQALKRLRELLGDEAYYAGNLPPHVPVWRFQRID